MTSIHCINQAEAADILGVTPRTIRDWGKAEGLPRNQDGSYSAPALVAWYVARAAPAGLDPGQERARRDKAYADKLEMDNAVRRGELLRADLIGDNVERMFVVFRDRLRGLPTRLAPRVNPEKPNLAREILATELDAVLQALADHFSPAAQSPNGRAL